MLGNKKFQLVVFLLLAMNLVLFGCKASENEGTTTPTVSESTTVGAEASNTSTVVSSESMVVSSESVAVSSTEHESEPESTRVGGTDSEERESATIESTSSLEEVDSYAEEVRERFVGAWYPVYILDYTRGGLKIKHPFQVIVINRDGTVSVSEIGEDLDDKSGNGTGVSKYSVVGDTLVSVINNSEEGSEGSGADSYTIIMSIEGDLLRFQIPHNPTLEVYMARDRDSFDFSGMIDPEALNN